jgi:hypothetical protein
VFEVGRLDQHVTEIDQGRHEVRLGGRRQRFFDLECPARGFDRVVERAATVQDQCPDQCIGGDRLAQASRRFASKVGVRRGKDFSLFVEALSEKRIHTRVHFGQLCRGDAGRHHQQDGDQPTTAHRDRQHKMTSQCFLRVFRAPRRL